MKPTVTMTSAIFFQNERQLFDNIGSTSNITFAFPVVRSLLMKDLDALLPNITYLPILETPGELLTNATYLNLLEIPHRYHITFIRCVADI